MTANDLSKRSFSLSIGTLKAYAKKAEQLYIAVRSEAEVMSTAIYHEPPATVSAHVTKAVIRSMYGMGECWFRWTDNSCVSTICAVVRTR